MLHRSEECRQTTLRLPQVTYVPSRASTSGDPSENCFEYASVWSPVVTLIFFIWQRGILVLFLTWYYLVSFGNVASPLTKLIGNWGSIVLYKKQTCNNSIQNNKVNIVEFINLK